MSRTTRNPVDLVANPTKTVRKSRVHRKVRSTAREALHRAIYFDAHADFGLDPCDLFWVIARKIRE